VNVRLIALGLACSYSLFGQYSKWQDACFNNPRLPYCIGHDSAVRPQAPPKDQQPQGIVRHPGSFLSPPAPGKGSPSVITLGGIDWRFADPFADVLAGFNLNGLSGSPATLRIISQLAAKQDLSQAEMERIFESLAGVNQIALSVRDNRTVIMVTGRVADSTVSELPPGWKAVPLSGIGMLMGLNAAVDNASQRITTKAPLTELELLAGEYQNGSEFWALGSGRLLGEQGASAGVKRFSMAISILDRLTVDQAYELDRAPQPNAPRAWPANISGAVMDGNVVHVRSSIDIDEVAEKFPPIAGGKLGQNLGSLVKFARYLPERQNAVIDQSKPVIYGLDDGPKVVKQ
jgi:hypothetical protein